MIWIWKESRYCFIRFITSLQPLKRVDRFFKIAYLNLITFQKDLKKKPCSTINFHLSVVMIGTILAHQKHNWVSANQTSKRKMIRWQQKKGESHAIKIKPPLISITSQMLRKIPTAIILSIPNGDNLIGK